MELASKVFLRKCFKDFFFKNRISPPSEVARREFGVGTLEDKIKSRHKAFSSVREFATYLRTEAPFFISYSAAYYEFPANTPMSAKNWLGADLVFDLDAPMEYLDEKLFERVKGETQTLIDFLVNDFGFSRKEVGVNFSGSKGYHLHITNESVRELSSEARREIVDYVTGSGIDVSCFMTETRVSGVEVTRQGSYEKPVSLIKGPKGGSGGWAGRIYDAVYEFMRDSNEKDFMRLSGIGKKRAADLVKFRDRNLRAIERRDWTLLSDVSSSLIPKIVEDKAVRLLGDADKMVTIDTARLMRLPDTIHGGTGLTAARVKDFDSFNPLVDAIAFGDNEVAITASKKIPVFSLNENNFGPLKPGEKVSTPEYAAIYLILKKAAEFTA